MKPWIKWTIVGLLLALLLAGAVRTLTARQARQAALDAQQTAQKIQVPVDLMPADLIPVKQLDLPQSIFISGTIKAVSTALVKARLPGELQGLVVLREGDAVKAGQVLARIDPIEVQARLRQAREQMQATQAEADMAQRSFDNNRALVTQGFISGTQLESSRSTLAAAQANVAAAQSGVDLAVKALDDAVLRAPISGQIAQRLAQTGERVAIDSRILEIVDNSRLEFEAALNPTDSLQLRLGQLAQLRIEGMTVGVSARVVRINPSAAANSRTVQVYLAIEPGSGLRQGLFAEGHLATGTQRALAVPLSAVRTDKPKPYVQTVSRQQVQHQTVDTGLRSEVNGETMLAITGVAEGTLVIGGPVGSLRAGTPVNTPVASNASAAGKP